MSRQPHHGLDDQGDCPPRRFIFLDGRIVGEIYTDKLTLNPNHLFLTEPEQGNEAGDEAEERAFNSTSRCLIEQNGEPSTVDQQGDIPFTLTTLQAHESITGFEEPDTLGVITDAPLPLAPTYAPGGDNLTLVMTTFQEAGASTGALAEEMPERILSPRSLRSCLSLIITLFTLGVMFTVFCQWKNRPRLIDMASAVTPQSAPGAVAPRYEAQFRAINAQTLADKKVIAEVAQHQEEQLQDIKAKAERAREIIAGIIRSSVSGVAPRVPAPNEGVAEPAADANDGPAILAQISETQKDQLQAIDANTGARVAEVRQVEADQAAILAQINAGTFP